MRAVPRHGGKKLETDEGIQHVKPEDIPPDDGIVPVLFPRSTWEKVQEMARAYGVRPAEVLILALENLDKEIRGGDGP